MAAAGESPRGSRGLVLSAVALALFAGAMFWALQGPSDDPPEAKPTASVDGPEPGASAAPIDRAPAPSTGTATAAPAATAKAAPAVDLFAGEMPDFMANSHARVLDKKWLGAPEQKALFDYGKQNPTDARPQLLLAWDSMNREWDGIAVRMYRIAYRADARAKQDPSMLRDLLRVAATHDRVEYRETTEIVREAFGGEALDTIEEKIGELHSRGDAKGVDRLERLRAAITGNAAN
jgi:hypothetical protein